MINELHLSGVFKAITSIKSEQKYFGLETYDEPQNPLFKSIKNVLIFRLKVCHKYYFYQNVIQLMNLAAAVLGYTSHSAGKKIIESK